MKSGYSCHSRLLPQDNLSDMDNYIIDKRPTVPNDEFEKYLVLSIFGLFGWGI
jgi:hypothetical protein